MSATQLDLEESIDRLAEMVDGARALADTGQMVELDVLSMKIAVLTDALNAGRDGNDKPSPYIVKLERLMDSLNKLEIALRKGNVNLTLDLEQADRRLRAQLAYGGDSDPKSDD